MKRGIAGPMVLCIIVGISSIYLGFQIISIGDEVSQSGGMFQDTLDVLGGLWSIMGMVLVLLGVLCFPLGLGFSMMKEWGRKNGVYISFFIAAICTIAGFLVAYASLYDSIIYFVITVMAIILGQLFRERRGDFEQGSARRKRESMPTYREVRHVEKRVIMHRPSRVTDNTSRNMQKCQRCSTVNDPDRTHCKMCGKPL